RVAPAATAGIRRHRAAHRAQHGVPDGAVRPGHRPGLRVEDLRGDAGPGAAGPAGGRGVPRCARRDRRGGVVTRVWRAVLAGVVAFFGVFEPRWQQSPSNFRSHGLEDLTVVWLGLLVGVVASALIRAVTDRAVEPVPEDRAGDEAEPSASQTAAAGEETPAVPT